MPVWRHQATQFIGYIRERHIGPYESNRDIHGSLRRVLRPARQYCGQPFLNSGLTVHHITPDAHKSSVRRVHARSSLSVVIVEAFGHFHNDFANGRFVFIAAGLLCRDIDAVPSMARLTATMAVRAFIWFISAPSSAK